MPKNKPFSELKVEMYLAGELAPDEKLTFEKEISANKALHEYIQCSRLQTNPLTINEFYQKWGVEELESAQKNGEEFEKCVKELNWPSPKPSPLEQLTTYTMNLKSWFLGKNSRIAFGSLALALLLFSLYILPVQQKLAEPLYASKGIEGIKLSVNGIPLLKQKIKPITSGDTLSFFHRNSKDLFFQVWYLDDNGPLHAYLEASGTSQKLTPITKWNKLSAQVILDSHWKTETIFVLSSSKNFSSKEAQRQIESGDSPKIHLEKYQLTTSTKPVLD